MGTAIAAVGITAIAGMLLSRSLMSPLYRLQQQAQQLKAGNYAVRSALKGKDELTQLGHLLDEMAEKLLQTLDFLKQQETSRRELIANVSHDFRTPLSTLRLNLEAPDRDACDQHVAELLALKSAPIYLVYFTQRSASEAAQAASTT